MESKRDNFLRIFANIPEKIRSEDIIAVVNDMPYTWNAAAIEVKNETALGKKILKELEKVGVI